MNNREADVSSTPTVEKRVILSMGGKGGVGKTSVITGLAEWFEENEIPVKLLDLDTENKARGSLTHFFGGRVPKVNIHTPAGLDAFIDELTDGAPVILADMGAGAGHVTYDWFDKMYDDVIWQGLSTLARCDDVRSGLAAGAFLSLPPLSGIDALSGIWTLSPFMRSRSRRARRFASISLCVRERPKSRPSEVGRPPAVAWRIGSSPE